MPALRAYSGVRQRGAIAQPALTFRLETLEVRLARSAADVRKAQSCAIPHELCDLLWFLSGPFLRQGCVSPFRCRPFSRGRKADRELGVAGGPKTGVATTGLTSDGKDRKSVV